MVVLGRRCLNRQEAGPRSGVRCSQRGRRRGPRVGLPRDVTSFESRRRDARLPVGRGPGDGPLPSRHAAHSSRTQLQALRRPLRGSRGRRAATFRVRPLSGQPGHLRLVYQEPQQVRGLRRRDPGEPPVRRHPRLDGHRRAIEPHRIPRSSSTASTSSLRRRSSTTTGLSTSSSVTRSSASSSSGSAGPGTRLPQSGRPAPSSTPSAARMRAGAGRSRWERPCTPGSRLSARQELGER